MRGFGLLTPAREELAAQYLAEFERRLHDCGCASLATLRRRARYGGRKGRAARRRLVPFEATAGIREAMAAAFAVSAFDVFTQMRRIQDETSVCTLGGLLLDRRIAEFRRVGLVGDAEVYSVRRVERLFPWSSPWSIWSTWSASTLGASPPSAEAP